MTDAPNIYGETSTMSTDPLDRVPAAVGVVLRLKSLFDW
jgi:hypothetical protein